jgi:hypothetical protein
MSPPLFDLRSLKMMMVVMILLLISSCGTTGQTSRSVIELKDIPLSGKMSLTNVASVERDPDGIMLYNVGTYAWGNFDDDDQANLEATLKDTLAAATQGRTTTDGGTIKVYLMIRKYIVGTSNNAGAVWAGLDWCAADSDKKVLFQETFYATSSGRLLGTIGLIKDKVNFAIVKRIARQTFHLAANSKPTAPNVTDTYSTFEEAAVTMPEKLQSWGVPFFVGTVPIGIYGGTSAVRYPLNIAAIAEPIDWQKRLTEIR